jgi:hypothetical protein
VRAQRALFHRQQEQPREREAERRGGEDPAEVAGEQCGGVNGCGECFERNPFRAGAAEQERAVERA